MSDIDTDLTFKGRSPGGISCEDFIKAVRRHAVVVNKSRDNEYIADYAMSWLTDDALHWVEALSDEVQGDWSLLRRALLAQYGSPDRNPGQVAPSLPSAMIPVPAAAPAAPSTTSPTPISFTPATSPPQILRGRIKVTAPNFEGWISKQLDNGTYQIPDYFRGVCLTTTDLSDACNFTGTIGNGGLQFKFESLSSIFGKLGTHLGIVWTTPAKYCAALTVIKDENSTTSSLDPKWWNGLVSCVTWIRSPDNTLNPKLDNMTEAGIVIYNYAKNGTIHQIGISSGVDAFLAKESGWKKASFVFEPI